MTDPRPSHACEAAPSSLERLVWVAIVVTVVLFSLTRCVPRHRLLPIGSAIHACA